MTAAALETVSWAGPVDLPLAGELDVQAACGLMHVHGRRFGRPTRLGLDYASITAVELAGIGAAAVEVARARGIALRAATTSVAQAALLAVSQYLAAATAEPRPERHEPGGPPFRSAEGVAFELDVLDAEVWQRFWAALGAGRRAVEHGWRSFPHRFATATCPLPAELLDLTALTPIAEVAEVARRTGATLVRVASRVVDHLHAYRSTPLGDASRSAPGGVVRRDAGLTSPLSGLVVLESCRRVQGPLAGHLLGLLGATVVRIEPPGGDPSRGVPPMAGDCSARFLAVNRGKQVVEVDLRTPAGRRCALELASAADVFLHDWAPRRADAWALGPEDVARARPGIVYAHASGWGGELGPEPPPGSDFLVQAHAGVPPTLMTVVEVFGGLVAAHGIVDGLLRRVRTGRGRSVATSLLSAASRLNARSRGRCAAPLTVPVRTDLAGLGRDPRFARALVRDGCVFPASPWEFVR
ncbi:CoA transferase [Actinosynnema sp. NPDC047251]|uniref:L-carnitine dehydratase/bile acid-inducible protein F n=1 Tax=Saccharothrix espanaensis (strain ATCC 51144 / DSM 44229 / JCM 9112 / NBRC 15066 / NRRL 15764) TaxID=1179773 RepID=K0JTD7_SACES|nr:CoA transferase [Saccharothrix espanaensis]CCH31050.1 L-carnitine dehydratase/bile acid-inducible protein F [Saccharothrix espanaensis DSM 44229]